MTESPATDDSAETSAPEGPWYAGITRYQWLVLVIASAGWVFDVYEGQIFNITRSDMLTEILGGEALTSRSTAICSLGSFYSVERSEALLRGRSPIVSVAGRL